MAELLGAYLAGHLVALWVDCSVELKAVQWVEVKVEMLVLY